MGKRSFGAWLSLVERLVRDQEVGGSNPLAPTIYPAGIFLSIERPKASSFRSFCFFTMPTDHPPHGGFRTRMFPPAQVTTALVDSVVGRVGRYAVVEHHKGLSRAYAQTVSASKEMPRYRRQVVGLISKFGWIRKSPHVKHGLDDITDGRTLRNDQQSWAGLARRQVVAKVVDHRSPIMRE